MSRPLIQLGIAELEGLFAKSRQDKHALKGLEAELEHRQVSRARSLLALVRTAMKATDATVSSDGLATASADDPSVIPTNPDFWPLEPLNSSTPEFNPPAPTKAKVVSEFGEKGPLVPVPEAYRLLNANSSSSWESIELARQQLVQRASPAVASTVQKPRLQEEADKINAAYKALAVARMQGS